MISTSENNTISETTQVAAAVNEIGRRADTGNRRMLALADYIIGDAMPELVPAMAGWLYDALREVA